MKKVFFKNMKTTMKLSLVVIVSIVALLTYYLLSESINRETRIGQENYNDIINAKDLTADILPPPEYIIESYLTALQYLSSDNSVERSELVVKMEALNKTYLERHDYWNEILEGADIRKLILEDSYKYVLEFYDIFNQDIISAVNNNKNTVAIAASKLKAAYENHRETVDKAVVISEQMVIDVMSNVSDKLEDGNRNMIIALSVIIIIFLLLSYFIAVSINRPLAFITESIKEMALGKLSVNIDDSYISKSEIGQACLALKKLITIFNDYITEITMVLGNVSGGKLNIVYTQDFIGDFKPIETSLKAIVSSLRDTVGNINDISSNIYSESTLLSDAAASLAQGSTEQASAVEELTVTISEIDKKVQNNNQYVKEALERSNTSNIEAQQSWLNMKELLKAIDSINISSQEISKIIKLIDDIAFQTNILALNASVEASRAGKEGLGFSVVANEIRTLSVKCAEAATKTNELVENSLHSIQGGIKVAESTGASLDSLITQIKAVKGYMDEIDYATSSQAASIRQVSTGIGQIAQVVQSNTATAEETSATSQHLYSQSNVLKNLVDTFNL